MQFSRVPGPHCLLSRVALGGACYLRARCTRRPVVRRLIAVEGVERVSAADLTTFIRLDELGLERRIVTSSIGGQ